MTEPNQADQQVVEKPAGSGGGQDKTLAMLCHLGGILGLLPPLIIWLIKKDDSPLVDENGKEALNFQLTILIGVVASWVLMFVLIGIILLPLVWVFNLVMVIIAAVKTNSGEKYRYPICIRFIK